MQALGSFHDINLAFALMSALMLSYPLWLYRAERAAANAAQLAAAGPPGAPATVRAKLLQVGLGCTFLGLGFRV